MKVTSEYLEAHVVIEFPADAEPLELVPGTNIRLYPVTAKARWRWSPVGWCLYEVTVSGRAHPTRTAFRSGDGYGWRDFAPQALKDAVNAHWLKIDKEAKQ